MSGGKMCKWTAVMNVVNVKFRGIRAFTEKKKESYNLV
jgi:hypothetical protein